MVTGNPAHDEMPQPEIQAHRLDKKHKTEGQETFEKLIIPMSVVGSDFEVELSNGEDTSPPRDDAFLISSAQE